MEILLVVAIIGGVVFLVSRLNPGTPEDAPFAGVARDEPDEFAEEPLPGLGGSPRLVTLRTSVPRAEAPVIQSLLESNGIRTLVEPDFRGGIAYESPADAPWYRLRVAAEDAETANALLEDLG